jgi:hypothetical protein
MADDFRAGMDGFAVASFTLMRILLDVMEAKGLLRAGERHGLIETALAVISPQATLSPQLSQVNDEARQHLQSLM